MRRQVIPGGVFFVDEEGSGFDSVAVFHSLSAAGGMDIRFPINMR
jgi:hypothetical protein